MKKEKHTCLRGFQCMYFIPTLEKRGLCTYSQNGPDLPIDLSIAGKNCELKFVLAEKEISE